MSKDDDFKRAYFQALGLDVEDKCSVETAWKTAHDIRKFEIELYWKRSGYFWAFQISTFAALGIAGRGAPILPSERSFEDVSHTLLIVFIATAGLMSANYWRLVTLGSKRWQDNWERHVDMLEGTISGNLYKTYVGKFKDLKGAPYSVSKVNQRFASFVTILWLLLAFITLSLLYLKFDGWPTAWIECAIRDGRWHSKNLALVIMGVTAVFCALAAFRGLRMGDSGKRFYPDQDPSDGEEYTIYRRDLPPGSVGPRRIAPSPKDE